MAIQMKIGPEGRAAILEGAFQLNAAVSSSLGPAGRWTLFRHGNMVVLTKDGVTIAGEINLPDVFESMGADRLKGAARQAVNEAGDGTTTAVLLGHAILEAGCNAIDAGSEPVKLTKGILRAVRAIVGDFDTEKKKFSGGILQTFAIDCTPELAFEAARISANGDEAIAKAVSEVVLKVGVDGDITIDNSMSTQHVIEFQDGLGFKSGWAHPGFVNDAYRNRTVFEKPMVLVINRQISTATEVVNIMKKAAAKAQSSNVPFSLVLIADDFTPEALGQLLHHRMPQQMKGDGLDVVAIRAPLWKDARRDVLDDICMLTNGTRIENPQGKALDQISSSSIGFAGKVIITQTRTTITAGEDEDGYRTQVIEPYLARLTAQSEDTSLRPDEVSNLKSRLAALTGGVAVIKVGGTSVNDVEKLKFQVEDAIHATRAAVAEGVVPGGGSALLFAQEALHDPNDLYFIPGRLIPANREPASWWQRLLCWMGLHEPMPLKVPEPWGNERSDEVIGFRLLLDCLDMPIRKIASNAGYGDEVLAKVRKANQGSAANDRNGFDASTGLYPSDMFEAGIVDPLRVVRSSLNAAASEACLLLLTEVVLGKLPEEAPKQMTGMVGGQR